MPALAALIAVVCWRRSPPALAASPRSTSSYPIIWLCAVNVRADETRADSLIAASALFKIGLSENRFGGWQPALALGFRTTLATREVDDFDEYRAARLFGVASKTLGPLRLHVGVDIWDAEVTVGDQREVLSQQALGDRVRPFGGLSWTPSIYPRTSLIGDFSWAPVVDQGRAELRWLAGWGVHYQALDWGSIELAVRHRQGRRAQ